MILGLGEVTLRMVEDLWQWLIVDDRLGRVHYLVHGTSTMITVMETKGKVEPRNFAVAFGLGLFVVSIKELDGSRAGSSHDSCRAHLACDMDDSWSK